MPFSHDEVVHGKATIVQKMNGEYEEKFPQARALYMYMYAHPGKKLNFMGNEFAQLREWDEKREQDWDVLVYPAHDAFHLFMRELSRIYLRYPALSRLDYEKEGFQWLDCHQEEKCIYAFMRADGNQKIVAVFNFSDKEYQYRLRTENINQMELLFASDNERYGGSVRYQGKETYTAKANCFLIPMTEFSAKYFLAE